jgi:dinuclear metal center YbgI/SA1388 family protein
MTFQQFSEVIELVFPLAQAVSGDPVGRIIEPENAHSSHVLVCLDITPAVIDEAINRRVDTILCFHPPIYRPLSTLRVQNQTQAMILALVENRIAVYCCHTALDNARAGTNHRFAHLLGAQVTGSLPTIGVEAVLPYAISGRQLIQTLFTVVTPTPAVVRTTLPRDKMVQRLAIVCGSGFSEYPHCVNLGCDVVLTADCKYHNFMESTLSVPLVDIGHYEMEAHVPALLIDLLVPHLDSTIQLVQSTVQTNPIVYFSGSAD